MTYRRLIKGGSNDFTKDNDGLFVCDFCRTKYTPEQAQKLMVEGVVQIDRSAEAVNLVKLANTAWEHENLFEALDYVNRALEIEPERSDVWMLKGKIAGRSSTQLDMHFPEMIGAFRKALDYTSETDRDTLRIECAKFMTATASTINNQSWKEVQNSSIEPSVIKRYYERSFAIISLLQEAHQWGNSPTPVDYILTIAKNMKKQLKQLDTPSATRDEKRIAKEYRRQIQSIIDDATRNLFGSPGAEASASPYAVQSIEDVKKWVTPSGLSDMASNAWANWRSRK